MFGVKIKKQMNRYVFGFSYFVKSLCMDGFSKSDSALSGACCEGPDPYRPIGK